MKKWMAMLLCCALMMGLAACGAGSGGPKGSDSPQERALHFEVVTQTYEDEYKAEDGTVLLAERYELPTLELRTEDGESYAPAENVTAGGSAAESAQIAAQSAFNTEMSNVLAGLRSEASQMAAEGKELYETTGSAGFTGGSCWVNELSVTSTYMTEEGLLSVVAENYTYYGGAHPNSVSRTWSFDLTTGEFLTLDALSSEEGNINGDSLQTSIYQNIVSQIDSQGLSEAYFDDYDSYLSDFPAFATFYFTATGMTVAFDTYIIAPYAAGPQVFDVPYSVFYSALNERAKTLLEVPQEQIVLSDFDTAATLWSWLFITTPPTEDTPDEMEINGYTYYQADIPGVSTLADMRELMYRYFDKALADRWLEETERYAEANGRLYVLSADRGSNDSIMDETCSVALDGESGTVTQTVTYGEWDEATQSRAATGEETFAYPFTLVDGYAVFSAFPYPY